MVRFRKISPLPYKAKSIGNLNKKIGSSTQGKRYSWDVEKKCWFDDRGKRVFNFKQKFIKTSGII